MRSNIVKVTCGTLEYYILSIGGNVSLDDIKAKLVDFKKMQPDNQPLILSIRDITPAVKNNLDLFLNEVSNLVSGVGFSLYGLEYNEMISLENGVGIPVLKLNKPKTVVEMLEKTLMVDEPLRSGMKVQHNGDVIITSFVSNGAEVIAGGNIHVYGEGRGRLIAGKDGDKSAKIFVTHFNPELISIGGVYRVLENDIPANLRDQPVMITLDKKSRLNVVPL